MASGPYPNIEINLGEAISFAWEKFLRLIGKDSESIELKEWFARLQTVGFTDASNIQCMGMHGPVPLQDIFQPTKLVWQVPHISIPNAEGGRITIRLPQSPVTPESFLGVPTNAAIFAGPGWGKTTFLHHMLLKNIKSEQFIPILITLRMPSAMNDLVKLVGMLMPLKKLSRGMRILLLVDGYDEISTTARQQVSETLLRFQAAGVGRFYLTCREFYEVLGLKMPVARIAPFDREDQERFVQSYATAFGSRIRPAEMLQELRERGMEDLLTHPLLLTMVCIVKSGYMSLHSKNALTLIDRALETLSFRWDEGKGVSREQKLPVDGRTRVHCLMRIAFNAKTTQVKERIVMDQARAQLDLLRWEDLDEYRFMMETARFFGILVPKDDDYWEFIHKTLHDYLAARYWIEKGNFAPESVTEWNSTAAYAACLSLDATGAMLKALSKKKWFPAFIEMLSNDAPFEHPVIASALMSYYERNPTVHFYETKDRNRISVHLEQDFICISSTKFLHDLTVACSDKRSKAKDTFFGYAALELHDRGQKLSTISYAQACRVFGPTFKFTVRKTFAWESVSIDQLIPE